MAHAPAFLEKLEDLIQRGAVEHALHAIKALCPMSGSERCRRLRRTAIQLLAQLGHAIPTGSPGLMHSERSRLEALALGAVAEARDLFAKGVLTDDEVSSAESALETLPHSPARAILSDNAIFISYRRTDSADAVGRLLERLQGHYGAEAIFVDVASMPLGVDFRDHVAGLLQRCRICLVVIGRQWLSTADASGLRRLDDLRDPVRLEIEAALSFPLTVIPIFVGHATMPASGELPVSIAALADRSGLPVRPDPDFNHDVERLIAQLQGHIAVSPAS